MVYANPFPAAKGRWSFLAYAYATPYFHQNWNLFAPAPTANYQLFVDYYDNGWQRVDIFNELVGRHQANRLRGYEPLVVAFSNSIHYFEKNSALQQPLNGPVKNDLNFTMLERAVQNYLRFTRKSNSQPKRLMLLVEETGTHKKRIYFN